MSKIQHATAADVPDVRELLQRSGLPVDGLSDQTSVLLIARDAGRVVGSAALELYATDALLRSVAVDAGVRGTGLGHGLTNAALEAARQHGVRDVFLLTTTAESFFPRFGFERVDRGDVPEAVRQSIEFTSACPASAVILRKHVTVGP